MEWDVDRIETEEASDGAELSELTLEMFIMFAFELEELGPVNTGAGGKGNIVLEILDVGGETDSNVRDDKFSDNVTLLRLDMLVTFLGYIWLLISLLVLLTCPLV